MRNEPRGRILPPKWKQMLDLQFLRPLTFAERVKLLVGYTLKINLSIACEHSPGKVSPQMKVDVSPQTDPNEQV